jgi:stearoyl-CoA desaturase (delta-9 desaturase)
LIAFLHWFWEHGITTEAGRTVYNGIFWAVVYCAAILSTTAYLHRCKTHQSWVITNPNLDLAFRTVVWMTTGIKPAEWVAVHRAHHANTDQIDDPHSPLQWTYWKVQFQNVIMYVRFYKEPGNVEQYAADLLEAQDKYDRRYFNNGWHGVGFGLGMACLIAFATGGFINTLNTLVAGAIYVPLYLGVNAGVNSWSHTFGYTRYKNTARNGWLLAWLAGGEGLHNNHHGAQFSWRFWRTLPEHIADWGSWFISFFIRVGWGEPGKTQPDRNKQYPRLKLPYRSRTQFEKNGTTRRNKIPAPA